MQAIVIDIYKPLEISFFKLTLEFCKAKFVVIHTNSSIYELRCSIFQFMNKNVHL